MPISENEDKSSAPTSENEDKSSAQLDPAVISAVVDAYYSWVFSRPDMARNRAQAAFGIASAIAAALVALGILGKATERPIAVQVLGLLALCAWLITSILFIRAVSGGKQPEKTEEYPDVTAFATNIIGASLEERASIDRSLKFAVRAAAAAAALTVIALGAIVRVPAAVQSVKATVNLSKHGQESLAAICGRPQQTVQGQVTEASLRERFIKIIVDPKACQGQRVKLYLPTEDVLLVTANLTDR